MLEQVPCFNDEAIAKLVLDIYGIKGEISALVSFEDQNVRIKTADATYVLKIANTKWSSEFMQIQTDVLEYLKTSAPQLTFPVVLKSLTGETMTTVDGFAVRLLTYLEGELLTNAPRTPQLYQDVGRFLGQLSKVMQDYPHAVAEGSDEFWKLDNVMACKVYLSDITDLDARDRIERLYAVYQQNILPKLPQLRKAIIHSDANEQNFLINPEQPMKIAGLIDFGELQLSSQINELAIALAYGLLGENDIAMASASMIEGYHRVFKLEEKEREILYYLMAMRLVTSITMSSHSAKLYPDNEYILISQKPARALLKKLEDEKYILA
jgi:Ser/Thr protein kinase RdoA (MazF antagonist)